MATMTAFLVLPGLVVGLCSRLPLRIALAASIPGTFGIAAVSGYAFGHWGIRWSWGSFAVATALVAVLAATVSAVAMLHARGLRGTLRALVPRPRLHWTHLVGVAVLVSAWLIGQMILSELAGTVGGTGDVFQGWDAHWHADYIRFIHDTGQASPDRAGDLRYPENAATLYYPSTWHALAALVMGASGVGAVETFNLMQIGTLALGFPLGVAALTWAVLHRVCPRSTTATAAAVAAVATPLFPGLPFVEIMVAATPSAVANSLSGLVVALVLGALADRRIVLVAALGLIGIGGVHPSALVTAAALLIFWWLFRGLWRPVRTRWSDVIRLAVIAVAGAATLVPQMLTISEEADSISAFEFQVDADRAATWGRAVTLQVRHVQDWGIRWVLMSIALVGALYLLRRGVVWPVLAWAGLVVVCVNALKVFGTPAGGWLRAVGRVYYNDPRRVGVVLAVLVAVAVGTGVAAVAQGLAGALGRLLDPVSDPDGTGIRGARVGVALAALVGVTSWTIQAAPEYAVAAGTSQRWGRLVDAHDLRAFRWLSEQPKAYSGLIYTNPDEGSGWMYATDGLPTTARHYLRPDETAPLTTLLFTSMDEAGTDPTVDAALAELGVTYVYISPPNYWGNQKPNEHLLKLDSTPGLLKVYSDQQVRIFAVRAAFTPDELHGIAADSPFPPSQRPAMTRAALLYPPS